MKRLFLLLSFITTTVIVQAQKDIKAGITLMLRYAETDFKGVIGDSLSPEPELEATNYTPKETIGVGTEKIVKGDSSDVCFYICSISLLHANQLIHDALELANEFVQQGKFTGEDTNDGKGKSVTEIRDTAGNKVMHLISEYSDDGVEDNDYFAVIIYSKTMQVLLGK
jgi:hypothetical protein